MQISNIDKNIFILKNFISQEEADVLLNIALNSSSSDWEQYDYIPHGEDHEWENRILMLDPSNDTVNKIFTRIQDIINKIIGTNKYEYTGFNSIYRAQQGDFMKTHADIGLGPKFKYGIVLYLNGNYTGGEIYYPNLNIVVKPEALSLVLHPANEIYRHGVREVTLGTRYSMTSFIKLK